MSKNEAPELMPCPFCGSEFPKVDTWYEFDRSYPEPNEYEMSEVTCGCGVKGIDINRWNTRVDPSQPENLDTSTERVTETPVSEHDRLEDYRRRVHEQIASGQAKEDTELDRAILSEPSAQPLAVEVSVKDIVRNAYFDGFCDGRGAEGLVAEEMWPLSDTKKDLDVLNVTTRPAADVRREGEIAGLEAALDLIKAFLPKDEILIDPNQSMLIVVICEVIEEKRNE